MRYLRQILIVVLTMTAFVGCGVKDEEKANQNRPAIPGY